LVHSDDLRYVCHFARFFSVFFQGFAVWISFTDCESSTPWVKSDAPIVKIGWRFRGQTLMNSWDASEMGMTPRNSDLHSSGRIVSKEWCEISWKSPFWAPIGSLLSINQSNDQTICNQV
jgi:hypothetical protein